MLNHFSPLLQKGHLLKLVPYSNKTQILLKFYGKSYQLHFYVCVCESSGKHCKLLFLWSEIIPKKQWNMQLQKHQFLCLEFCTFSRSSHDFWNKTKKPRSSLIKKPTVLHRKRPQLETLNWILDGGTQIKKHHGNLIPIWILRHLVSHYTLIRTV